MVSREVTGANGNINTIAGLSVPSPYPGAISQMIAFCCYSGDGYPALQAEINYPYEASLVTDQSGDIFIADTYNNAVREISAKTGLMSTVARMA